MKNYKSISLLLIAVLFISGTDKNRKWAAALENKLSGPKSSIGIGVALPDVSIGDMRVVRGNKGMKPVEVMIILSQKTTSPVTVTYSTKDGNASAGIDYVATSGSVTFAPGEIMKRITVSIIGNGAGKTRSGKGVGGTSVFGSFLFRYFDPNVTFQIILTNVSGATPLKSFGIVNIISDILSELSKGLSGTAHEVQFSATGYTSLYGSKTDDCPVRTNGHVVLSGLLVGDEKVEPKDDVRYTGILQLDIDMDICSVMRLPNGEDKFCSITVCGFGSIPVELEIHTDGRGAYIKFIDNYPGFTLSFIGVVTGSCDVQQTDEERSMVPYKTIASVFNGIELPMLTDRTLRPGPRRVLSGEGLELAVDVLR
ncbi:MAG: Calx-beta domain-containing protein [Ginsengibacter sp.]